MYRYGEREKPFEPAVAGEDVSVLEEHIARHLGTPDFVFHELVSDLVHVDV
ncbi:MAG: suppressor of fused domain protein, partial [Acidobacteria bacterium]|nr:suppressor of fused domain protein [Acidobacteriota bacterium]